MEEKESGLVPVTTPPPPLPPAFGFLSQPLLPGHLHPHPKSERSPSCSSRSRCRKEVPWFMVALLRQGGTWVFP